MHVNHLPRLQLDHEEGEKWTQEEVGHLQKITGPYLCRMIAEKRFPVLSTGMFWANMSPILLIGFVLPIRLFVHRSLDLSAQDDELLPQQRVFRQQFGFAPGQIGECTNHEGGRWWLYPPQNVFLKRLEAEKDALLEREKRTAHT
jgi:hypothetical protein